MTRRLLHWLPCAAALLLLAACGGGGSSGQSTSPAGSTTSTGSGNAANGASGSSTPGGGSATGTSGSANGIGGSTSVASSVFSAAPMTAETAARLLNQATFGPTLSEINAASGQTYDSWFSAQAALSPTHELPLVTTWNGDRQGPWWTIAVTSQDQLRQRVAFALSQILVVSQVNSSLSSQSQALANYYDLLVDNALGNYRDVLDVVSHSPVMGLYLTFFRSPAPTATTHADQNYAREVMQLFTVGLWKLNQDGTRITDAGGKPIPSYTQSDVSNLARAFTGWASAPVSGNSPAQNWLYALDLLHPMNCYSGYHDSGAKTIIGGIAIPAGGSCDSDMKIALDALFNHPNVGPFLGRQLIQRLVTSNPSPGYVARVAAVFSNNGNGVRGDLLATAKAILTDPEATHPGTAATAGKLREPVLKQTQLLRAFSARDANNLVGDGGNSLFNTNADVSQASLYAPTVFNFFRPDYQAPGALTSAGLVAPEFQITNEYTVVSGVNDLSYLTYAYLDSQGHQCVGANGYAVPALASTPILRTAALEALASSPAMLVDTLSLMLMDNQMPSGMRTAIIDHISTIPLSPVQCFSAGGNYGGTGPAARVIDAVNLVVTSSAYAVER